MGQDSSSEEADSRSASRSSSHLGATNRVEKSEVLKKRSHLRGRTRCRSQKRHGTRSYNSAASGSRADDDELCAESDGDDDDDDVFLESWEEFVVATSTSAGANGKL